jgi:hypothetical protein
MSYTVKELFLTAQGEGANIGRIAVFIRFAGCNLVRTRRRSGQGRLPVLRYGLCRRPAVRLGGSTR